MMMMMVMVTMMVNVCDDNCCLVMKVILVKEVMSCDVSPVAMFKIKHGHAAAALYSEMEKCKNIAQTQK